MAAFKATSQDEHSPQLLLVVWRVLAVGFALVRKPTGVIN